jgi:hypothetical protein
MPMYTETHRLYLPDYFVAIIISYAQREENLDAR